MRKQIYSACICFLILTVVTGVLYPLLVTGIAKAIFPTQASGSLLPDGGGSRLIGQSFEDPKFFWGRLSATSSADGKPQPYNAASSSGSNLGPLNSALADAARARIAALRAADSQANGPVPIDLVTASASGLDPHISPAAAEFQVQRVARVRHLDSAKVRALVAEFTEPRQLGVLGEPRVNVLLLNKALPSSRD